MFNPFKVFTNVRTLQAQVADHQTTIAEHQKTITDLQATVRDYHSAVTALIGQDAVLAELRSINGSTKYVADATRKERAQRGHHD